MSIQLALLESCFSDPDSGMAWSKEASFFLSRSDVRIMKSFCALFVHSGILLGIYISSHLGPNKYSDNLVCLNIFL